METFAASRGLVREGRVVRDQQRSAPDTRAALGGLNHLDGEPIIRAWPPIATASTPLWMPFPRLRWRWRFLFLPSLARRRSSTLRLQPNWIGLAPNRVAMSPWKKSAADSDCDPPRRLPARRHPRS